MLTLSDADLRALIAEDKPIPLMSGLDKLTTEIARYLSFVDCAREEVSDN